MSFCVTCARTGASLSSTNEPTLSLGEPYQPVVPSSSITRGRGDKGSGHTASLLPRHPIQPMTCPNRLGESRPVFGATSTLRGPGSYVLLARRGARFSKRAPTSPHSGIVRPHFGQGGPPVD